MTRMIPMKPDELAWGDDDEVLHIIPQSFYHQPDFIAGTLQGMTRLRDARTRAIEAPRTTQCADLMCSHGEGYAVHVRCEGGGEMDLMPTGYADREMCPSSGIGWPAWMLTADRK